MNPSDPNPTVLTPSSGAGSDERGDCGIHRDCQRVVPAWIVFVDNAPTAVMFGLGTFLMWQFGWVIGTGYLAYCFLAIIAFWGRICPWCHHFGTHACPSNRGCRAGLDWNDSIDRGRPGRVLPDRIRSDPGDFQARRVQRV
jgi:hypothetical protein